MLYYACGCHVVSKNKNEWEKRWGIIVDILATSQVSLDGYNSMSVEIQRKYAHGGNVVKETIVLENAHEDPDVEASRPAAHTTRTEEYTPPDEQRRNLAWLCMGGVVIIVLIVLLVTLVPEEHEDNSA